MKPNISNSNITGNTQTGLNYSVNSTLLNNGSYPKTPSNKCSLDLRSRDKHNNIIGLDSLVITFKSLTHSIARQNNKESIIDKILSGEVTKIKDYNIKLSNKIKVNYLHTFYIYSGNILFGELDLQNRLQDELISFKVNNLYIYENRHLVYTELQEFTECFELEYNNINYLEIANDTLRKIADNLGYVYHNCNSLKFNDNPLFSFRSNNKITAYEDYESFTVGKKKNTGKVIAIYNKTNEAIKNGKLSQLQYINNSLYNTSNEDVHRVEVRLTNKGLKNIEKKIVEPIDLKYIFSIENQQKLFKYAIGELFKISDLSTKTIDKNRNSKYEVIDLLPLSDIGNLQTFNYSFKKDIEPTEVYKKLNRNKQNGLKAEFDSYLYKGKDEHFEQLKEAISNNLLYKDSTSDYVKIISNWLNDYDYNILFQDAKLNIELLIQSLKDNYRKYEFKEDSYSQTSTVEEPTETKVNNFNLKDFNSLMRDFDQN